VHGKSPASPGRIEATFCFIDLTGFTALAEAQGDEDAADVATRFANLTRAALGPGDRLVKTIGDAVLVTSRNPASGVALVERLLSDAAAEPGFPALRAGLHHGEAVQREGDVFGAAVNLAARVASEAHSGEVLGTESVARAARATGIPVAELGSVLLKNVREAIPLFSLALVVGATETPVDPVCRTPVDRRGAAGRLRYHGAEYWFCSLTCAAAFASNPGWHAAEHAKSTRRPPSF
jgi:adenylate cyclase